MKKVTRSQVIALANEQARKALATKTDTSTDHLGDLAWWDPKAGWKEDAGVVANRLRAHKLDPVAILPLAPDWNLAFGRAVQSLRTTVHVDGYTLLDAALGTNGERRVAIVHVSRNGRVTTDDVGTVVCPKDGASPYVERHDPEGIGSRIVALAQTFFGMYTSDDIRSAVTAFFTRWAAMPCRNQAPYVVYWIPASAGEAIRQLADALEDVGWGRIELFAGYASDERSARSCVNAVNQGLESKLAEFAAEASKYTSQNPKKTRVSTIESKMQDAMRLRQQGALYREILGSAVIGVETRIAQIEATLRDTLGMVEKAHAA